MGATKKAAGNKARASAAKRGRYAPEGGGTLRKGRKKMDEILSALSVRRRAVLVTVAAALALAAVLGSVAGIVAYRNRTVSVRFDRSAWPVRQAALLDGILEGFESLNPKIRIDAAEGTEDDLVLTIGPVPADAEFRPWRLEGFRLYARLDALASLEGEGRGPWIRPLERIELSSAGFADLERAAAGSMEFIGALDSPAARKAWDAYASALPAPPVPLWYSDAASLVDDLERRRLLFAFWNDSFPGLIPVSSLPAYRGFAVPGTRGSDGVFAGRAWHLVVPEGAKARKEARALVKYLTSPGIAKELSRATGGEFLRWDDELAREALPVVGGPSRIADVE